MHRYHGNMHNKINKDKGLLEIPIGGSCLSPPKGVVNFPLEPKAFCKAKYLPGYSLEGYSVRKNQVSCEDGKIKMVQEGMRKKKNNGEKAK